MNIKHLAACQREYFETGATRSISFRREALLKLKNALKERESQIELAMKSDLNKAPFEIYMTETGIVFDEINFHLKHLSSWIKAKRAKTPLVHFSSKSYVVPEPYGVVLIMSPWNYPIQLILEPLIGAISAGNCAVLKPSAYAPETSKVIAKLIGDIYPKEYIAVVEGGREENNALFEEAFDYIFFTGSVKVGKAVMEAAAKNLTPVTLELGGKSPVIVDETANLKNAAKRIAFGKVLNAGQTCVGPDYLLIHENVKDKFLEEYKRALEDFFPDEDYSNMPVIVNDKHFNRLTNLLKGEKIAIGGKIDGMKRFIEPTVLVDVAHDSPIMREEIFGPILPVLTYIDLKECIDFIRSRPKPLALYLFTQSKKTEDLIFNTCSFGGGCVNDTIVHLASPYMGFGGVGHSGMGSYHGKQSFDTFTHYRSILKKYNWIDLPIRYHPYSDKHFKLIRFFMK
ncbi:aldehyde dehydrogenase [Paratissierella segnis]|jgi:aldehyde dehydrogenase (NAD+)|nr:aldehyde dehydrogenase [Paratissierella segnis]